MQNTRLYYLDNLRSISVVLVLVYHVFYFFNNKGVFGGMGGFSDNPLAQPQDAILYLMYPWIMMLLFLVAGISARYALRCRTAREFFSARTRKLLVPSTIGLLFLPAVVGYFTFQITCMTTGFCPWDTMPDNFFIRYIICMTCIGPLWFIQELWIFSILLLFIRWVERGRFSDTLDRFFLRFSTPAIENGFDSDCNNHKFKFLWFDMTLVLGGALLVWFGAQDTISNPTEIQGLYNLYRPNAYFVPFLLGYFVFSNAAVQERVAAMRIPMIVVACGLAVLFTVMNWGEAYTSPEVLKNPFTNLFAYTAILALLGAFKTWCNRTSPILNYLNSASFGLYIVHYVVLIISGYYLRCFAALPAEAIYVLMLVLVLGFSPILYQLIRCVPVLRWCVLGVKGAPRKRLFSKGE